jgi:hypothetical protein
MSLEEWRALLRLRIATAAYEANGSRLEPAIRHAMLRLDWPKKTAREIERVRTWFRRGVKGPSGRE